ncbi:hypothetical protein HMPREF3189_00356 [Clostridiales bacterium KA00134]|nr:hypothetical protein HMPREF3189_00356 [Clostridiales bacterium KA00134]
MKKFLINKNNAGIFDMEVLNLAKDGRVLYFLPSKEAINQKKLKMLDYEQGFSNIEFKTLRGFLNDMSSLKESQILPELILEDVCRKNEKGILKDISSTNARVLINYIYELRENFISPEDLKIYPEFEKLERIFYQYEKALKTYKILDRPGRALAGLENDFLWPSYDTVILDSYHCFDRVDEKLLNRLIEKAKNFIILSPFDLDNEIFKNFKREDFSRKIETKFYRFYSESKNDLARTALKLSSKEDADILAGSDDYINAILSQNDFDICYKEAKQVESFRLIRECLEFFSYLEKRTRESLLARLNLKYFPVENSFDVEKILRKIKFENLEDLEKIFSDTRAELEERELEELYKFIKFIKEEIFVLKDLDFVSLLNKFAIRESLYKSYEEDEDLKKYENDCKLLEQMYEILEETEEACRILSLDQDKKFDIIKRLSAIKKISVNGSKGIDLYDILAVQGKRSKTRVLISMDPTYPRPKRKTFLDQGIFEELRKKFDLDYKKRSDFDTLYKDFLLILDGCERAYFLIEAGKDKLKSKLLVRLEDDFDFQDFDGDILDLQEAYYLKAFSKQKLDQKESLVFLKNMHAYEKAKKRIKREWTCENIVYKSSSTSQIQAYLDCPYKFYLKYILKLEIPSWDYKDKYYLELGNFYHKILEDYFKIKGFAEFDENILQALFEREFLKISFPHKEVGEKYYFEKIKACIKNEILFASKAFLECKEFEKKFVFSFDDKKIYGKIDRIDVDSNNLFHILDYKSGLAPSIKAVKNLENVQLLVYALYLKNEGYELGGLSYCSIKDLKRSSVFTHKNSGGKDEKEDLDLLLQNLEVLLEDVFRGIDGGDFSKSEKCKGSSCEFFDLCGGYDEI